MLRILSFSSEGRSNRMSLRGARSLALARDKLRNLRDCHGLRPRNDSYAVNLRDRHGLRPRDDNFAVNF